MKFSHYIFTLTVIVLACLGLSIFYFTQIEKNEKKLEATPSFDIEIETLRNTQEQWIKQTELLAIINRLSFNLQSADLEHRELNVVLGDAFEENQMLKSKLQKIGIFIGQLLKENESLREQLKQRST